VAAPRELGYLDASAFVKLVVAEAESRTLRAALSAWPVLASSTLLEVESVRAARRKHPSGGDAARALLDSMVLLDIDADVCRAAADLQHPGLRSLDAIHLATALSLGERCGAFFAYDDRLIAAARAHGLTVSVPRP
jgi:predicted nucleic acid-binding protein